MNYDAQRNGSRFSGHELRLRSAQERLARLSKS